MLVLFIKLDNGEMGKWKLPSCTSIVATLRLGFLLFPLSLCVFFLPLLLGAAVDEGIGAGVRSTEDSSVLLSSGEFMLTSPE